MSIAVIGPSGKNLANPFLHQPYWEMYFATILNDAFGGNGSDQVDVIDLRGSSAETLENAVDDIAEHDVFVYWILRTFDATEQYQTADFLKRKYPKSLHVAGGTHVEKTPTESSQHFDAVVVGPGENSFVAAVNEAYLGRLQPSYSQNWAEVPFRDKPFPRRDFLPADRVVNEELFKPYGGGLGTMVYFSRGCSYACAFCHLNVPTRLDVRDADTIRAELDYLKREYGVKGILLKDEVAIHKNPTIANETLEAIGEADILWKGQTTTVATSEQLKLARETGCQELAIGVETVDSSVMRIINKHWQDEAQIRRFIGDAKKLDIKVKMCVIMGLPGEPRDIVERTIKFIEETEVDYVNCAGFTPLPGSPMYENPDRYGIASIDHEWSKHQYLVYRFSDDEVAGVPFEYHPVGPWGKAFTRDEIIDNIRTVQVWLRDRERSY